MLKMVDLTKLVGISLFGSAALAMGVAQMREHPEVIATMIQPAPIPQQKASSQSIASTSGNSATLFADSRGHFYADIQIRGAPLKVLVDTGASLVAMSFEDAAKIGVRSSPSDRKAQFNTANGIVTATLVRVPEIRLQGITVFDVEAAIMPQGVMKGTLLGMSFMKKLSSFESRGVSMIMRK
jgi:aspartyl protease family protein